MRRWRPVLLFGGGLLLVVVLVPLLAATAVRPEERSVLGTYLGALGALAAISLGAAVFFGWEIARHHHHRRPAAGDHDEPSG